MPKIYFIPLLFKGSFPGDNKVHLRAIIGIICGRGSSEVGDYWRYCTVDWCGGSATILSIIIKYKWCIFLIWKTLTINFFNDNAELFFSDKHRVKKLFQWLSASYSLFFSLKNLCEGKRKEKERKNWRRKKVPTTLFLYIVIPFKKNKTLFCLVTPNIKGPFFPLILLQKNLQEQNGKDKRWKKRWLKVRHIHYFMIFIKTF